MPTQTFVVADPKNMDGNPYDVAERALRQSAAVASILEETLTAARTMTRNAEMERQLSLTGECSAADFEDSAIARRLDKVRENTASAIRDLELLAQAAGFDPKNPPK